MPEKEPLGSAPSLNVSFPFLPLEVVADFDPLRM